MTDEEMERLATRVIQRLQPPVLVMVTAGEGYRQAIQARLAASGLRLHIIVDDGVSDSEQWQPLGETQPLSSGLPVQPWQAVLLPFLDYPLAAAVVNGTLNSPVAQRLHEALLAGLPVLALRYHCDPASELNQLCGAAASTAYAGQMQATLARLQACGVTLCTMNELLEKLAPGLPSVTAESDMRRYHTVTDLVNNPALASAPGIRLTDAAVDYVRKEKNNPTLVLKPGVK